MSDPLAAPLRQWLRYRYQRDPRLISEDEDAANLRRILAAAGLEVVAIEATGLEHRGG